VRDLTGGETVSAHNVNRQSKSHRLVREIGIQRLRRLVVRHGVIAEENTEPGASIDREVYGLTTREDQILRMLVVGPSLKDVAGKLGVSYNTVSNHVRHIHQKLHVHSRGEVIAKAFKENLI
jgi:DNA-binding NarL/FixJ family response regulator